MLARESWEEVTLLPVAYWNINWLPGYYGVEVLLVVASLCALVLRFDFQQASLAAIVFTAAVSVLLYLVDSRQARAYCQRAGSRRLNCHGPPRYLKAIESISGEFREPYITSPTVPTRMPTVVIALIAIPLVSFVGVLALGFGLALAFLVMCGAIVAMRVILRQLCPVYYRVVPGRLDILKCRPLSNRLQKTTSISLSDAMIECRFDEGGIYITEDERRRFVPLTTIPHVSRFVKAVFEAAISPHDPGVLPDDELLG